MKQNAPFYFVRASRDAQTPTNAGSSRAGFRLLLQHFSKGRVAGSSGSHMEGDIGGSLGIHAQAGPHPLTFLECRFAFCGGRINPVKFLLVIVCRGLPAFGLWPGEYARRRIVEGLGCLLLITSAACSNSSSRESLEGSSPKPSGQLAPQQSSRDASPSGTGNTICEAIEEGSNALRKALDAGSDPSAICTQLTSEERGFGLVQQFEEIPALVFAASRGDADVLRLLLESGAPINSRTQDGMTALTAAARAASLGSVETLLANGAQPNARDEAGRTALMQVGEEPVLSAFFLRAMGRVEEASQAATTERKREEQLAIVQALIAAGADVSATDNDGMTALARARADGRDYLVRPLSGASVALSDSRSASPQTTAGQEPAFDPGVVTQLQARANRAGVNKFYVIPSGPAWPAIDELLQSDCDRMILWNAAAVLVYGSDSLTVPQRFPGSCVFELGANAGNLADEMLLNAGLQSGHDESVLYEFWPRRLVSNETDSVSLMFEGRIGQAQVRAVRRKGTIR